MSEITRDLLEKAIFNKAWITCISAEDAAECERSIPYKFTPEQSCLIFKRIQEILDV